MTLREALKNEKYNELMVFAYCGTNKAYVVHSANDCRVGEHIGTYTKAYIKKIWREVYGFEVNIRR